MTELAYALDYLNAAQTYLASYMDDGRLASLVRATESTRRGYALLLQEQPLTVAIPHAHPPQEGYPVRVEAEGGD